MKLLARVVTFSTLALLSSGVALAQAASTAPYGLEQGQAPPLQFGVQVQGTHANAPPSGCGCFWLEGGGVQAILGVRPNWGAMLDITYASASQINGTSENLSVLNVTGGARYTVWRDGHWSPYGQLLAGLSRVGSNYKIYSSGDDSLAAMAGLGVNYFLSPHYSIIPIEANWVYSQAANNVNSHQSNFRIGAGVVYRIGPH